jgi:hypothetical protein
MKRKRENNSAHPVRCRASQNFRGLQCKTPRADAPKQRAFRPASVPSQLWESSGNGGSTVTVQGRHENNFQGAKSEASH